MTLHILWRRWGSRDGAPNAQHVHNRHYIPTLSLVLYDTTLGHLHTHIISTKIHTTYNKDKIFKIKILLMNCQNTIFNKLRFVHDLETMEPYEILNTSCEK